ncbi:zinc finger MYM-type 2-like, partial [Paramuricea clavata]
MIADTPVASSSKRLTNHSARKTLVKKLRLNNVERSSIMNMTGHRNEQSLNDYDEGNENEQRHISDLIGSSKSVKPLSKRKPMSMNMMNILPPSAQQPSTLRGFERLGFFPTNTFNN